MHLQKPPVGAAAFMLNNALQDMVNKARNIYHHNALAELFQALSVTHINHPATHYFIAQASQSHYGRIMRLCFMNTDAARIAAEAARDAAIVARDLAQQAQLLAEGQRDAALANSVTDNAARIAAENARDEISARLNAHKVSTIMSKAWSERNTAELQMRITHAAGLNL